MGFLAEFNHLLLCSHHEIGIYCGCWCFDFSRYGYTRFTFLSPIISITVSCVLFWTRLIWIPIQKPSGCGFDKKNLALCEICSSSTMLREDLGAPWLCCIILKRGARLLQHLYPYMHSKGNFRHLAFIGATITVLLLLFDPFLQQVVIYPDHLVASQRAATIARAQNYQARSEEGLPLPSIVDMSMKVGKTMDSPYGQCRRSYSSRLPSTAAFSMSKTMQT